MISFRTIVGMSLGLTLIVVGTAWDQSSASVTSGFNPDAPTTSIDVPWEDDQFSLEIDLDFNLDAGYMEKSFQTPSIGTPITTGMAFPVRENFVLVPEPTNPWDPRRRRVSDWREELVTPGWTWAEISGESLITKDGLPWSWQYVPMSPDPTKVWVNFPPLSIPDELGVNKLLIWQGTAGNTTWGDGTDDEGGTVIDESVILAIEYPTPEPASAALLCLGALAILSRRR